MIPQVAPTLKFKVPSVDSLPEFKKDQINQKVASPIIPRANPSPVSSPSNSNSNSNPSSPESNPVVSWSSQI